ncbi:unnamed protein product [Adineta steineri]|uniref:F-box domain-containing protein n=1 Tax=Adineta steineri TaxID=433720 RepID=A0A813QH76_9BILA|nr:unnamed protein product [Adineta steineri]CAF3487850.1 unnamed protein product [Adineta steineri]
MSKKTRTQFLDLEDISLRCVFQYLSIQDRFTLFFDFFPCRIQPLLENFISFVNISNENDEWIQKYLPKALTQRKIFGLCLKEKQIDFVSKYFSLGDIQTIYLITTYINDKVSANYCIQLCQYLNKLVLLRDKKGEDKEIFIYPIVGQDYIFQNLTDLSINLSKIDSIFTILQRLPNLQTLKMHLENSRSYDEQEIHIDNIESCTMLRNVKITGVTSYRHEFQTFFALFGSTIQFLTINITILENQPFLTQLEHDVLNKMPLLSSFNFFIKWNRQYLDGIFVIDTQIFQNSNWQRFGQVICCHNRIIYNLPYKFSCFEIMTNDLNLLYNGSKSRPSVVERVRTVLLRRQKPWWSINTFRFIRNSFPNVRTLYFHCKLKKTDDNYMQIHDVRFPELFDNDFHNNNEIQLLNVTTVYLNIEREQFNYLNFRYLFNLLPNLKIIKTNRPENARKYVGHCYNDIAKNKLDCLKIEHLHIPQYINTSTKLFYYLCEF